MAIKIGTFDNTRDWIDFSSLDLLMKCPRWYYWRAVCNITTAGTAAALVNGAAYHNAWAAFEIAKKEGKSYDECVFAGLRAMMTTKDFVGLKDDPIRNVTVATDTLQHYWKRWQMEPYKTVDVEIGFAVDIGELIYIGKIDRVCDSPFGRVIMEHKTTTVLGDRWNERGRPNAQVDGYYSSYTILTGEKLYGGVLDVCPIPAHKQLKNSVKLQDPFRIIAMRGNEDIDAWIVNTNEWWRTLLRYRESNTWPMNTERCHPMMGYSCPYTTLCKQFPNPHKVPASFDIPNEYKIEKWAPFELAEEAA